MPTSSVSVRRAAGGKATLLLALLLCALALPSARPAAAATEPFFFPQTGHYARGVFRDFWEKNGGLANFGYPLTEEYIDARSGRVYQFFERVRLERAGAAATEVQVGALAREYLGTRTFPRQAQIANNAQRRYFPETGQIVQYGFKDIWEGRGGQAIFGLPLSSELQETLADGRQATVQYFERVRFEFRADLPAGQRVLISDLGRTLAPRALTPPLAPNTPPPALATYPAPAAPPSLVRPVVPAGKNARAIPAAGPVGQTFTFEAIGFSPDEEIAVWATAPGGEVLGYDGSVKADGRGTISAGTIGFGTDGETPTGTWAITAQGRDSGAQAIAYFVLLGSSVGRVNEQPPGPGVPPNTNARAEPGGGRPGTLFFFDAFGFRPGEQVQITITASDGSRTSADFSVAADGNGSIGYAGIYFVSEPGMPLGLYTFRAVGRTGGATSTAYFVLTP
ncbi:MAG TPA: hypothetical protein VFS21_36970 [Roseiflexaceae bacterium]|nr:hypothetical protein [Roseiflexaceae bacterium]